MNESLPPILYLDDSGNIIRLDRDFYAQAWVGMASVIYASPCE